MPAIPRVERAIIAIVEQLKTITTAAGYHTNSGLRVHRARRSFAANEVNSGPVISVFEVSETPNDGTGRSMTMKVEIAIDAHIRCGQADTGAMLGLVKADIKRCLGAWDCDGGCKDATGKLGTLVYGGATADSRENGGDTEAVSLKYTIAIVEARNDPANKSINE